MLNLQDVTKYLKDYNKKELRFMEVCGTHTASIFKSGIRSLISPKIKLISGPGCPVCVTSASYIDRLCEFAAKENHTIITFGDMLKVTGNNTSLYKVKAMGAKVKMVYSPLEALALSKQNPNETYIIAAVGFETTAVIYALLMEQILKENIKNIKLLTAIKTIIPALSMVNENNVTIDGFIAPGHVSAIIGANRYKELAKEYKKPFCVAGFEAEHILAAIYDLVKQSEKGIYEVHNHYKNAVKEDGNIEAMKKINFFFEPKKALWRGIGEIEESGLYLKKEYCGFDAGSVFNEKQKNENSMCRCGAVICGEMNPNECPLFRVKCTPNDPQGACMVSPEGACGIWFRNGG